MVPSVLFLDGDDERAERCSGSLAHPGEAGRGRRGLRDRDHDGEPAAASLRGDSPAAVQRADGTGDHPLAGPSSAQSETRTPHHRLRPVSPDRTDRDIPPAQARELVAVVHPRHTEGTRRFTRRKQALIVGPYRAHNFGDDLVGGVLASHLQRRGYEVAIPRLSRDNCEWLGTQFSETYDGAFEKADVVVVGGGGIMSDTSGAKPGASHLDIVARASMDGLLTGTPIYVTSVGAGPWILGRSKMLAFGVSLIADRVGVREQESYDHLRRIGVSARKLVLGADLALLTPELLSFPTASTGKIGLQFDIEAFRDVLKSPDVDKIMDAVGAYASAHSSEVVLLRNGRLDSEIVPYAGAAERLNYTSLSTFLPRLGGLRSLFTSHLHLAITSYAQRIPTYSLFVREKTRRFYEQIGHPERAIDLRTAKVDDVHRFLEAVETATWTDADEMTLRRLKAESAKLIEFIK